MLILLPGLTGGSHDTYIRHMVGLARRHGMRSICFNSRGTSDGPVITPQFYSASFTGDCRYKPSLFLPLPPPCPLCLALSYQGSATPLCPTSRLPWPAPASLQQSTFGSAS